MALSTGNISLQDAVNEISPASNTLSGCIVAAHTYGYDPTYAGARNSLYNLKGYDHSIAEIVSVSPTSYTAPNRFAGSFNVSVTSNSSWSGSSNVSWISFTPTGQQFLNGTVTISYNQNDTGVERSGRFTVTGEDGASSFCLITQPGGTN